MAVRTGLDPTMRAVTTLYLVTLAHHIYGGLVFASTERLFLALVFTVVFGITLWLFRFDETKRWATRAYWSLVVGFWAVLLGLYEGGFNHALHVVLRTAGASTETMRRLYPSGSDAVVSDDVFFQATGVLTLTAAVWVAVTAVARRINAARTAAAAALAVAPSGTNDKAETVAHEHE
jgi:hypothetical protein